MLMISLVNSPYTRSESLLLSFTHSSNPNAVEEIPALLCKESHPVGRHAEP